MNLSDAIQARSDQLNAIDLVGGPRTVTIVDVREGTEDRPVEIVTQEFGESRPFRPSKTVLRLLVAAWGEDTDPYIGRKMTLYRDPEVTWGGKSVGGVRVSHVSDIDKRVVVWMNARRGQQAPYAVDPMAKDDAIPKEHAESIVQEISQALEIEKLNSIAAGLRDINLGEYRDLVLSTWKKRQAELTSEPTEKAVDESE